MKTYKIFTSPKGVDEAVKQGWSWPAFFFNWVWAFVKRLWLQGVGTLILAFLAGMAERLEVPAAEGAEGGFVGLVGLIVAVVYGSAGNKWRENELTKRGFKDQGVVEAATSLEAVMIWPERGRKNEGSIDATQQPPGQDANEWGDKRHNNRSNTLATLDGWHRLYILIAVVYLFLIVSFVYVTFPGYVKHSSGLYKEMGKEAQEWIRKSDGANSGDITEIEFPNEHTIPLSNDLSEDEMLIVARDYWNVVEDQTNKKRSRYLVRAFLAWLIPMIAVYAISCGIAWVYKGFKDGRTPDQK